MHVDCHQADILKAGVLAWWVSIAYLILLTVACLGQSRLKVWLAVNEVVTLVLGGFVHTLTVQVLLLRLD